MLFTRGLESSTHRGVIQLLGLHFVRNGTLPPEAGSVLAQLEGSREVCDYAASVRFTAEEAQEALTQAESFIAMCRPCVGTIAGTQDEGKQ